MLPERNSGGVLYRLFACENPSGRPNSCRHRAPEVIIGKSRNVQEIKRNLAGLWPLSSEFPSDVLSVGVQCGGKNWVVEWVFELSFSGLSTYSIMFTGSASTQQILIQHGLQ